MNPYAKYLDNRNVLEVLKETPAFLQNFAENIGTERLNLPWAEGKWTANEIILHLLHVEFVHGNRLRYALTVKDYTVQPFEQDDWIDRESASAGVKNIELLISLRNFNLQLFSTITEEEKSRLINHPELGTLQLGELLEVLAGHDLDHRQQLEIIANAQRKQSA